MFQPCVAIIRHIESQNTFENGIIAAVILNDNKVLFYNWKLLLQLFLPEMILWFDIPDGSYKGLK